MVSLLYKESGAVKAESYSFEIHIIDIYDSSYAINEHFQRIIGRLLIQLRYCGYLSDRFPLRVVRIYVFIKKFHSWCAQKSRPGGLNKRRKKKLMERDLN